ncbi:hypothetical protein SAMN04488544_3323 [Microlunatus sagamiharensis]|uniref:PhiRv1 phage protein n=1 Tax=Microlunatus sagamiharensis TaxID=546874 RepID=A0A1H2N4J6_9ACTN|nr:hypothetical protein SAMN04488544_3323 [Microlunatus sagamiharensis]
MSWTQDRARVASLTRSRPANDPDLIAARQSLKASRLADHIRSVVESAPPLTTEQRARIASLLRSDGGAE